jgi:hypothetical protein
LFSVAANSALTARGQIAKVCDGTMAPVEARS